MIEPDLSDIRIHPTRIPDLPARQVSIAQVREFEQYCWFGPEQDPTCHAVAIHALRISEADLAYPIILSAEGGLMDGGHRVRKACMLGHAEVAAVQFAQDSAPEYILLGEGTV
jgi:hypothetical protein